MRPPSSKNSKRTSDEDRGRKKKKIKSKSSKRRRDSSVSSYSSADSDLDSRSRRKSSRSKKIEKPDKRKKETKKPEKKWSRTSRKKRSRRDSSVSSLSSYSGHSCSTCSDPRSSRSPVRQRSDKKSGKNKLRKRDRERPRKSLRRHESRGSGRRRSPSCSTCSGSRSESSGGRNRSRGRSPAEEKYREESETKRLRSVLSVPATDDEGKDKIIQAYDDHPSCRSDEIYDEGKKKDRDMEIDSYHAQISESERMASSKDRNQLSKDSGDEHEDGSAMDYLTGTRDADDRWQDSLACGTESAKVYTTTEVVGADSGKEAAELELILRQKALENLRKFRVASKLESSQCSKMRVKASESSHPDSIEDQSRARGASSPSELKARSVPSIPTEKDEGNRARDRSNNSGNYKFSASSTIDCEALNSLKPSEKSSNKISSEETLLSKDAGNKRIAVQAGSAEATRAGVGRTDRLVSGAINTENEYSKPNKPLLESVSGSQFEKKTFSRMHDGETVKVSYKVYIPNKTPALARRQLQR